MNDSNMTDRELLLAVDNDNNATPRELELAKRLRHAVQLGPIEKPEKKVLPHDHRRI